jgi:hypothetical protein
VSNADVGPLEALGASLAGSLLDPAGIPLWLAPELAAGRALRAGAAASRLGRLGSIPRGVVTGAIEGVAGGLAYEGVNLWLHHEAADDYDFGDASANVILGGVLGGAVGGVGGWWEGRGARPPRAPEAVERLSPEARTGAFADALEAVIEDRPVDLGPLLVRQAEVTDLTPARPEARALLDEEGYRSPRGDSLLEPGGPFRPVSSPNFREVAVTPRGIEVPVRYALIEADALITSHDDDLFRNPEYPADLQPRQRDRAGAQARNRALEAELNPKRLMNDVGAETGAPIVSRDGVVESGNGRTIAVRRSYRTGSGAGARYRAELEAQGFDTAGMEAPVLVRVRTNALDAGERVKLTRDMNAEATEAYSPSERAMADAEGLGDDLLGMVEGPDLNGAGNRRFVRAFLDRVASDDLNRLTTGDGRLSEAGLDRIGAAMTAKAFGSRGLVEALFEATDSNIKAIGKALAQAAPEWAAMRAAVARGEAPAALDPTEALIAAVEFVRHVRQRGGNLAETLELTIGQYDAFSGAAMTPETEAFIRSFFRTGKEGDTLWRSPRSAASLAEGLRWLAGEVRKAEPGPNLFGEIADESTARTLLDGLGQWFARQGDDGPPPGLDFSGPDPTVPAGGDVRPSVDDGGRVVGGPPDGRPPAGAVDGPARAGPADRPAADPGGTTVAGGRAGAASGQAAVDPADYDHIDANHADLWRLGISRDPALAADLSRRMSRFMDWTDVPLTKADRAAVAAREPVSNRAMLAAARNYQNAESGVSFYDPDLYDEAMWAQREADRAAGAAQPADPPASAKPRVAKGETPPPPKGEPFADPELKSPAQLEKGLKKAEKGELAAFTVSLSSGTVQTANESSDNEETASTGCGRQTPGTRAATPPATQAPRRTPAAMVAHNVERFMESPAQKEDGQHPLADIRSIPDARCGCLPPAPRRSHCLTARRRNLPTVCRPSEYCWSIVNVTVAPAGSLTSGASVNRTTCGFPTSGSMAQPVFTSASSIPSALYLSCAKSASAPVKRIAVPGPSLAGSVNVAPNVLITKLPFSARPGPCFGRLPSGSASSTNAFTAPSAGSTVLTV